MISVKALVEKLNTRINSGGLSFLEIMELSSAIDSIENNGVSIVNTESDLPLALPNKGRFYYVRSLSSYVVSNGTTWSFKNILKITALYAWGSNSNGRLGDNTATNRSSPVSVVGGFTDWIHVAGGENHALGLRADGTAWAWGSNANGQFGDNTQTNSKSSPVSVVGGFTDWIQVSGGTIHSLGLRANGTAWGWGNNSQGRVGDGTTSIRLSPVLVTGGFTDWIQVEAGGSHSLGLRANGTVWGWGNNTAGQLGNNTTISRVSPVSVVGGFTDWIQISCGTDHSLGLRANGTAWGWGNNSQGRVGDNTATNRSSPVSVVGGYTDWIQVSGGSQHSLGLRANGTAWAWGNNINGGLGDNTGTTRSSPVPVVGGYTDWIQISARSNHSLGIRANGTAWAWGTNGFGQLGTNDTSQRTSPVSVVGGFTDWIQVAGGSGYSLGLR
jgi:alpha-tubulin suppressor-like RCC1 family protein